MGILLKEHVTVQIHCENPDSEFISDSDAPSFAVTDQIFREISAARPRLFKNKRYCYELLRYNNTFQLRSDYYAGVDWLIPDKLHLIVEPKINTAAKHYFEKQLALKTGDARSIDSLNTIAASEVEHQPVCAEINLLGLLFDVMSETTLTCHSKNLVEIHWDSPVVRIKQQQDYLTPFLIVQFLQLLKQIVRKGLKRSYYKVRENLNHRLKGKLLIGPHVKQNILKNNNTRAYCEYQVFGFDSTDNRFLQTVLDFSSRYISAHQGVFGDSIEMIKSLLSYTRPAFDNVGSASPGELKNIRHHPFYQEYKEAIQIGEHILKRFSYNITQTSEQDVAVPPFWINMPMLFELYVYQQMLKANPDKIQQIHYQFSTYGNALDLLVSEGADAIVIDAKYKLKYLHHKVHQDIRQVAGYARLNVVRQKVNVTDDRNIKCLIIYPDINATDDNSTLLKIGNLTRENRQIDTYHKVYKLGIRLPLIDGAKTVKYR